MDLISILKADHRAVEDLFERFHARSPRARKARGAVVGRIVSQLSLHARVEDQVLHGPLQAHLPKVTPDVLRSREEHHLVGLEVATLGDVPPDDEQFDAKVAVVEEIVRRHLAEEEHDLFPKLRTCLSRRALEALGDEAHSLRRATARSGDHSRRRR